VKRRLDEASASYRRALEADKPRPTSEAEAALVVQFAPRLLTTLSEPFALRDVAAVLHPFAPWIAYHLLWEDDIDFPEDNDPCDHEVVWVRLDAGRERVVQYYTYFHGRILQAPPSAVEDAGRHGGRAAVHVQWGKHGSMPPGWERLPIIADDDDLEKDYYPTGREINLETYNRGVFRKLATAGRRAADSPLGRGWPVRFPGNWQDFADFSTFVEPRQLLRERRMMAVSSWNNALLDQHFLRYNFRPKTEWPPRICEDLSRLGQ
jgi:hypothetical protein